MALVVLLCACCLYVVIQRARGEELPTVFGFAFATVSTGSMSPAIEIGDMIVIKSCGSYSEGDVITYYDASSDAYITHRITGEQDGGFTTKGDYNNTEDSGVVAYEDIVGKVVLVLGGAGTVVAFMQTPIGIICVVGGLACLWIVYKLVQLLLECRKEKKQKTQNETADTE